MSRLRRPLPLRRIFAAPLLLALASLAGLFVALTGDGWRDLLGWAGVGLPLAVIFWARIARRT